MGGCQNRSTVGRHADGRLEVFVGYETPLVYLADGAKNGRSLGTVSARWCHQSHTFPSRELGVAGGDLRVRLRQRHASQWQVAPKSAVGLGFALVASSRSAGTPLNCNERRPRAAWNHAVGDIGSCRHREPAGGLAGGEITSNIAAWSRTRRRSSSATPTKCLQMDMSPGGEPAQPGIRFGTPSPPTRETDRNADGWPRSRAENDNATRTSGDLRGLRMVGRASRADSTTEHRRGKQRR